MRNSFPNSQIRFALQSEQRGTGDALRAGLQSLPADFDGGAIGGALVLYGDVPRVSAATLRDFSSAIDRDADSSFGFISVKLDDGSAYGRVIRDSSGRVDAIVEARDASPAELAIRRSTPAPTRFPRLTKLRSCLPN